MNGLVVRIIDFWCHLLCYSNQQMLALKWNWFLNEFILRIIHLYNDLERYHEFYTLTLKWTQLLNGLIMKNIHFCCDLQSHCNIYMYVFVNQLNDWMNLLYSFLFFCKIFNAFINCTCLFYDELSSWIDSSWKKCIFDVLFKIIPNWKISH